MSKKYFRLKQQQQQNKPHTLKENYSQEVLLASVCSGHRASDNQVFLSCSVAHSHQPLLSFQVCLVTHKEIGPGETA